MVSITWMPLQTNNSTRHFRGLATSTPQLPREPLAYYRARGVSGRISDLVLKVCSTFLQFCNRKALLCSWQEPRPQRVPMPRNVVSKHTENIYFTDICFWILSKSKEPRWVLTCCSSFWPYVIFLVHMFFKKNNLVSNNNTFESLVRQVPRAHIFMFFWENTIKKVSLISIVTYCVLCNMFLRFSGFC